MTAPQLAAGAGAGDVDRALPASGLHRLLAKRWVGVAAIALALVALLAFGIVGIGRDGGYWLRSNLDMHYQYGAGTCWWKGGNPYDVKSLVSANEGVAGIDHARLHYGFAYPPQDALLCMLLALLPLRGATVLMTALNAISAAGLAWLATRASPGLPGERASALRDARPFLFAVLLGNPFTTHVLWLGQTTLLAVACLVAGWSLRRRAPFVAGALLGVATLKPQIALLPVVWITLERSWKVLAAVVVTVAVLAAYPVWLQGPVTLLHDWLAAMKLYESEAHNVVGFQNIFGFQSLAVAAGLRCPPLAPLALGALAALFAYRRTIPAEDVLGLLLGASFLFVYAHDYDLCALAPLYVGAWTHASRRTGDGALVLGAFGLLFVPQRLLRGVLPAVFLHWRELVVLALVLFIVADALRRQSGKGMTGLGARPSTQS